MRVKSPYPTLLLPILFASFGSFGSFGCTRGDPTKQDRGQHAGREMEPRPAGGALPPGTSAAVASAEQRATPNGVRAEKMGRDFQGRIQMRVTGLQQPLELRYLSRGERGRLQIDRSGAGTASFDAIFGGDQVFVLDHAKRRYRTRNLNEVPKKVEPSEDVKVERTSEQREVNGLFCYPWRLTNGKQSIDACVQALPGPFETDKLETLSGFNVPAWVERVIGDEYMPIVASVTENGRELYNLELLQYSPAEVPENELAVPDNYQKL